MNNNQNNITNTFPLQPVVIRSEWFWGTSIHIITPDGKALLKMVIDKDNKDECELYDLNTHVSCRKMGYATQLMKEAEKIANEMNIERFYLWVERGSWMEKWYRRMGYFTEDLRTPPNPDTKWLVKFLGKTRPDI